MLALFIAALAPLLWGTNFFITTEYLPENAALWIAFWRACPLAIVWLLFLRRLPLSGWWIKLWILAAANVGLFFPLLFWAAYVMPGGLGTLLVACNPLLVALMISCMGRRLSVSLWLSLLLGVLGVACLLGVAFEAVSLSGVLITFAAVCCFALGTVLTEYWGVMDDDIASFTAWQLLLGSFMILPLAFMFEGMSPNFFATTTSTLGITMVAIANTGLAYWCWFYGLKYISAMSASLLTLLSPVVAYALDILFDLQHIGFIEIFGVILVFVALAVQAMQPVPKQSASLDDQAIAE